MMIHGVAVWVRVPGHPQWMRAAFLFLFFVVVAGPGTLVAHYSASPRALPPGRRARPDEGGRVRPVKAKRLILV